MRILSKTLEALGIAAVMIGLIDGVMGSMWLELDYLIIGLILFFAGWGIEKSVVKKRRDKETA